MTVSRQADDATVAEQVVLAIDLDHFMPEVEIGSIEPALCGDVGVHSRLPLALLNDHHRVGNERVAADVIEVKCELTMMSTRAGSRSIASSRALISSPGRKWNEKRSAARCPTRPAGSRWQSGCIPVSKSAVPLGCSIR